MYDSTAVGYWFVFGLMLMPMPCDAVPCYSTPPPLAPRKMTRRKKKKWYHPKQTPR